MPLTVGGGINDTDDVRQLLNAGADKVSINTSALKNPDLISRAAEMFGSQCIVVAVDAKRTGDVWQVFTHGGRIPADRDAIEWAKQAEEYGAGEILLTSMDADGTKDGFDLELTDAISNAVNIPVIASGGAGKLDDFSEVFTETNADAALAASVFHFKELTVTQVKEHCQNKNIEVRL